jgi:hypothetical protein
MTILLASMAVAFAALCVWLGVRIVNRRERWAKWTLVGAIVGVPTLYVLSFGPACWWFTIPSGQSGNFPGTSDPLPPVRARQMYWPIGWVAVNGPHGLERVLAWYATLGGHEVIVPMTAEEGGWWFP